MTSTMAFSEISNDSFSFADKCQSLFPSVCDDGYQPFLPYSLQSSRPANLLEAVTTTLEVSGSREVCFFHPGGSSEILPLQDLDRKMPEYELCIMPPDGSWLLYHTGNRCWQWGRQHHHAHLFDPGKKRFPIHWGSFGLSLLKSTFCAITERMETRFDPDDFLRSEAAFRESGTDSYIYIIDGNEVWIEIAMQRGLSYYRWQCFTQEKQLVEPWRAWFNHYR